jgi:hypothetical protein
VQRIFLPLVMVFISSLPVKAADLCEAIALQDVAANEDPASIIKRGDRDTAITGYQVDKKTGEGVFCSHGGYCYPTHVLVNGIKVEALKLTNCVIGKSDYSDADEISYSVEVERSKVSPAELKQDDVDNRLLELGLCSACAGNAASFYVSQPKSPCARLVKEALEGSPDAVRILKDGPAYCESVPPSAPATCIVMDPTPTPLNVRTAPYGRILGVIANGSRVRIVDSTNDGRGKVWAYIADQSDKPLGWIFRNYIECR